MTCIKWDNFLSKLYCIECGVRQGGVLSLYFFAIYIDSVLHKIKSLKIGCEVNHYNVSILMYADDIILCSPSVCTLQIMLYECEKELNNLDMTVNASKTKCLRFGPDYKLYIRNLTTINQSQILWEDTVRYLGCFLVSKSTFCISLDNCKRQFYISFNSVYAKIGGVSNEDVIIHLLKTKCLPKLLYGLEAVILSKSQIRSLENVIFCSFMKIFKTNSKEIILDCMNCFNFDKIEKIIENRRTTFMQKIKSRCDISIMYYSVCL